MSDADLDETASVFRPHQLLLKGALRSYRKAYLGSATHLSNSPQISFFVLQLQE